MKICQTLPRSEIKLLAINEASCRCPKLIQSNLINLSDFERMATTRLANVFEWERDQKDHIK